MDDLEPFETRPFISKLLGMGDVKGMMDVIQKALPLEKAPEMAQRLSEGKFSLRDMYEQLQNVMKMGPLGKVMEMMPGMNQFLPQLKGNDSNAKIKAMINILDSMTDEELDNEKPIKEPSRMARIARGSGRSIKEVHELIEQHKQFSKMVGKMKSLTKGRGNNINNLSKMASVVPPHIMKQMGGVGGLGNLMKQIGDLGLNIPGFK